MAQYNSKHTGAQIDAAVTRALSGGAIDQDIAKKMDATESTDYPGCYYRMVDGAQEWINPPIVIGTEYRTTERWNGSPVYAKLFDCSPLPNATTKVFPVEGTYADNVSVVVDYGGMSTYFGQSLQNKGFASLNVTQSKIYITTESDLSAGNAYVWVKYTKSA